MILAGSSASAAVAQNYLSNAHMAQRLADMKPIYDGFMPTSANGPIPAIDVPTILVPTMRETFAGNGTTEQDNERLRVYEFAGMAHIDSRVAGAYYPDPCKAPISRYPLGAEMAVALDKLFTWADKGVAPPHADRMYVDFNPDNKSQLDRDKGTMFALDEFGNVKGGIRNTVCGCACEELPRPGRSGHAQNFNPPSHDRGQPRRRPGPRSITLQSGQLRSAPVERAAKEALQESPGLRQEGRPTIRRAGEARLGATGVSGNGGLRGLARHVLAW